MQTNLMLVRSVAANNGIGLFAGDSSLVTLRVGQSTITGNTTSWSTTGGLLRSYGDNSIDGNFDGGPPIPTVIGKK
jgi:hypothetical protein